MRFAWILAILSIVRTLSAGTITVESNFDNGRVELVSVDQANRIVTTRVPADNHTQDRNMRYWHMRLSGLTPGESVTLRHSPSADIHYVYSYDGENWHRFPTAGINPLTFRFVRESVYIAPVIPYPYARSLALATDLNPSPHVTVSNLATSEEGRDIKLLRITDGSVPDVGKRVVWVQGRLHAFENHSSHVVEGFARWMASDDVSAADFRRNAIAYVVPIMDVDNVFKGMTGKDQPNDFNRIWEQSPGPWNAVNAAKILLGNLHASGQLVAVIDSHNPPYNLAPHWYVSATEANWNRFAAQYRQGVLEAGGANRDASRVEGGIVTIPDHSRTIRFYSYLTFNNDVDFLALTIESSQHKDSDGLFMTREGSLQWGEGIGRGLYRYIGGDLSPGNIPPKAKIAALADNVFSAAGSTDPEKTIASYHWDFGDGAQQVTLVPTATHAHAQTGDYAVTLRVRDAAGAFSAPVQVNVSKAAPGPRVGWRAEAQQNQGTWWNSGYGPGSYRVLVEGKQVTDFASSISIILQGRTSGSYTLRGMSVAKRDGTTLGVVEGSWTEVTFGSNTWAQGVTVAANTSPASNPIPFTLRPGEDLYVSFHLEQGGVYLPAVPATTTRAWFVADSNESARQDWQGLGFTTTVTHMYAISSLQILTHPEDDLDRDGLPDAWETHILNTLDEDAEDTAEGMTHFDRYVSGIPMEPTALPRLDIGGNPPHIGFRSIAPDGAWYGFRNRHYQVEKCELGQQDLPESWSPASAVYVGTGSPVQVPISSDDTNVLFRLRIWLD